MRWNLLLAGLAASWGFVAVLVGAVDLDAESLAFGRLALASLALACVAALGAGLHVLRPGDRLPTLTALGVAQGMHWLLFFLAVDLGSVALAVLTFYAAPVLIAVAAPLFLRERVSVIAVAALVPGGAGIALVALGGAEGGQGFSAAAVAAGLGSAATYAALVILSKRLLHGRTPPLTVAFWDCLVGAAVVAPALVLADRVFPRGAGEWGAVLLLGVVFTAASTLAYVSLLRHVTAQAAGLLTFLEPVAAVILAALLLDEPLTAAALAGGALVLGSGVAVVVLVRPERVTDAVAAVGSGEP